MSFFQEVQFRDGDDLKITQKKLRLMMEELARINRVLSRASGLTSVTAADVTYGDATVQAALDEIFAGGSGGGDASTLNGHAGSYYLAWANFTGVPSTFTPAAHTHAASDISYDHTVSGLVASQVQAAIDEIVATGLAYTDEQAQDAVGNILLNTATVAWSYADATPSISANVPDAAITFAKFVNATATARFVARKTAAGGPFEECTLSDVLDFIGSAAQGDILYRGAATWARLPASTAGFVLNTNGAGANPSWAAAASAGAMSLVGTTTVAGAAATTLASVTLALDTDIEYLVRIKMSNATASNANISLFYNADTTATNYDTQILTANNTTISGARANNAIVVTLSASLNATFTLRIIRSNDGLVTAAIMDMVRNVSSGIAFQNAAHSWRTTATNVTGLTLSSSVASALAIGTSIKVWKIT